MATSDKHGWNKSSRLLERRRKAQAERQIPTLDTPFPWRAVPFNPAFFKIPGG